MIEKIIDKGDRNFEVLVSREEWEREERGLSSGFKVQGVLYVVGWCVFVECVLLSFLCFFFFCSSFLESFFVVFSDVNHFFVLCAKPKKVI